MFVVIDRFEENLAVCEDENRKMINVEKKFLPKEAREGDALEISFNCHRENQTMPQIRIDIQKTIDRKKQIEEMTKDLWDE